MMSVAMLVSGTAREHPDRTAVIDGDTVLSYADLDERSGRVAALLVGHGVAPGDRVVMSCPNSAWFPVVYYGIIKAGAVAVPLNILLRSGEIAAALADARAVAYFCHAGTERIATEGREAFASTPGCTRLFMIGPELADALETVHPLAFSRGREPGDTAVVLYTSGTTGRAKGAEHSHAALVVNTAVVRRTYDGHEHDVHLAAAPLSHTLGMNVHMNAAFAAGDTLVPMARFEPAAAVRLMTRHKVTFFAAVPTMYWTLEEQCGGDALATALANLRIALSGGAPLPERVRRRYRERYGVCLLEGYGMSETGSSFGVHPREGATAPAGTIGKPLWGVEARLLDRDDRDVPDGEVGELALRGPCMLTRYLGRPEETAHVLRGGWLHTGDLARKDDDGFYFIVDRVKDVILRGGYTVYPSDIEDWFTTHPAVRRAVAVGVPDERYGEEIKVVIVRQPGADVTEEEMLAWGREGLGGHKYPRIVEFRDSLPLTPTGKIIRQKLR